jgi:DNA-binding CsgD family transcriptional regulator
MRALGMSYRDISVSLGIDKKTVEKGIAHQRKLAFHA